ncbi:MAG TPA: winged helix-turn-helix domain-containing protein [Solirubrobacterales bacterium]|nr:winged helix-turn-helix domain-containing protein [Solirubrobacterales bacterium]
MADKRDSRIDQELVKALSHPIRVEILEALQGRVASPSELSKDLDESLKVISYHAKTLVKCGCLELVGREPRRGSIEHLFGVVTRSSWERRDPSVAAEPGLSSASFEVDEIGWSEIRQIMDRASRLVAEAQARSLERLAGAEGISIVVGLAAFEARKRRGRGNDGPEGRG